MAEREEPRVAYLLEQVGVSFKHVPQEKLNAFKSGDEAQRLLCAFCDGSVEALFCAEMNKGLVLSAAPPQESKAGNDMFLYLVKVGAAGEPLSQHDFKAQVVIGECCVGVLQHAEQLASTVFSPLLSGAKHDWSELVVREVDESLSAFVANVQIIQGHVLGETALPLPPDWALQVEGQVSAERKGDLDEADAAVAAASAEKDAVHALESSIITWTKQIKSVLKLDPETFLPSERNPHPGPLAEISFWDFKARHLNSIFEQLQSTRVRRVLKCLDEAKSTYNAPFAKLCAELYHSRSQANDNAKFIAPLKQWVELLEGCTSDGSSIEFRDISDLFAPILHTLLLIWKGSEFYNTPTRLVVFVREVCNALVRRCIEFLNGDGHIFHLLDSDESKIAVDMLKSTLKTLADLKKVYFEYKDASVKQCPRNAWRVQNNAVFVRLDAFWERCHDVLELTQTTMQFSKLAKIHVGGTKGKVLSTSVQQIHLDFVAAVLNVRKHGHERLLDVEAKVFDDLFYEFRVTVKELERRLASVLTQGFDDAPTIAGRFKLLDSFDSLIQRPGISAELEPKYLELLLDYGNEVRLLQQAFVQNRHDPPIPRNLPPISGALTWCRGLRERVDGPMLKFRSFEKKVMEREEVVFILRDFTAFVGQLSDFESAQIAAWGDSVEVSSQVKLKNPLLRFQAQGDTAQRLLLYVNFDPLLVRLLREVKYFLLLGLTAPGSALDIYAHSEIFRRHTGNLDLIVNMYNWMQTSLLPVERPLLKGQLDKIDKLLAQAVGSPSRGVSTARSERVSTGHFPVLNWKSSTIDTFINEAMAEVKQVTATISVMKSHLGRIQDLLDGWASQPLLKRSNKAATVADFESLQKTVLHGALTTIRDGGAEVHRLLRETHRSLKVSQGLADWKNYVDYCNNIVVAGLQRVVVNSCVKLEQQLDPVYLAKAQPGPMLEMDLDLVDGEVRYIPEVATSSEKNLRQVFKGFLENFTGVATIFKRLDTGNGSYLKELQDDAQVQWYFSAIENRLNATSLKVEKLRLVYLKYDYLWKTDLQSMFTHFLQQAIVYEPASKPEKGDASSRDVNDDADSVSETFQEAPVVETLRLDLFEEQIQLYLDVQAEIANLRPLHEIDFLRVMAQPIKQALGTWVTKWTFTFTNYLQGRILRALHELHAFMATLDAGLDLPVTTTSDKTALMAVMTHIRDVRKRMHSMDGELSPLRDMVSLLKAHGISLDLGLVGEHQALDFLESAPLLWDNVVNKTFRVKESIQPLQNAMVDRIKRDISDYGERVKQLHSAFINQSQGPLTWAADKCDEAYLELAKSEARLRLAEEEAESLSNLQELFELNRISLVKLVEMRLELVLLKHVWDVIFTVEAHFSGWSRTLWADIESDKLTDETKSLLKQVKSLPARAKDWLCYRTLEKRVLNFAAILPLVADLHSPAMRDRHWKDIAKITQQPLEKGPNFALSDLLDLELHLHLNGISEVVEVANKENKVEARLLAISAFWSKATFQVQRHRETDVLVLLPPDEILEALEEHVLQVQSIVAMGRAVEFFQAELSVWQRTLGCIELVLKSLLVVQRSWMSLEAIFLASQDIRSQLPNETKRFEILDSEFKLLMADVCIKPGVVAVCQTSGREAALANMHRELETCQKALSEYLDMKKHIFPRFYFVSNVALLDMLSNSNNPMKIMPHVGSVFDGMQGLRLEAEAVEPATSTRASSCASNTASAMISKDGEVVQFASTFTMRGAVERWLNDLVTMMRGTLRHVLDQSLQDAASWDAEKPREEWVDTYCAQVALVTSQTLWTEETEGAFDELENGTDDAMKKHLDVCSSRLDALITQVQGSLTADLRNKIITLITIDVHSRDVVQALVSKKVESAQDFTWSSQMRDYWDSEKKEVEVRVCDFRSWYSFEYVGNCGRLVITPLTDRCYVTLTTALRLFLGGAPAGPAGTGKTETTKDLARGLGLPCYVFNCSDQMNYQTMGDIFRGLAQSGSWGCFDEFNRIEIEVLSVVATQVKTVLDAMQRLADPLRRSGEYASLPAGTPCVKVGDFEFFGDRISLVPTVGFFITMNPGYAGRTELPENLKASFRSCAMIRPDLRPICENMLMAEGFIKARPLAAKFVTLYRLSDDLLSKQSHYDWGLRAVKSVLRVAGTLKRAEPKLNEEAVLMRALRDFNTPKIPAVDTPIFLRLIADLFPGMELETKTDFALVAKVRQVCLNEGLQCEDIFAVKVAQFQQLLHVRHSVMLLGPAGSGKSTIYKTLAACHNLGEAKPVTVLETLDPKAVSSDELYGYMTLAKDWRDGCLSILMRNMSKNASPYSSLQSAKWVVLDGDIDAVWIESMNTVMDDNKVLTLVSNERIPLTASMRMVFEIDSLHNATPATVSRAGILYINEGDVGWLPFAESWVSQRLNETERATLPLLLNKYVPLLADLIVSKKIECVTPAMLISRVAALLYLAEAALAKCPYASKDANRIEKIFLSASVWAFGGTADSQGDSRKKFSEGWRALFKGVVKYPEQGTVFDYFIDAATGDVGDWADSVPKYQPHGQTNFAAIVVPTADLVALSSLCTDLTLNHKQVLFVGGAGTGKTILVREFLKNLPEGWAYSTVNMNSYTDAAALQMQLEFFLEKKSGKCYGPAAKRLIFFVDDLNMPKVERYGTQTPISLMRQHVDGGAWYDRQDLSLRKAIVETQYVAAMNHKAGSFSVSARLQRHFTPLGCQNSSESDLCMIFHAILESHLTSGPFPNAVLKCLKPVVDATLSVHAAMSKRFLPSAVKFHYNFNMRDLAAVFQGLCSCKAQFTSTSLPLCRLWLHECARVYADRLVSPAEIARCHDILVDVAKRCLDEDPAALLLEPNIWTNFATPTLEEGKSYLQIKSKEHLRNVLEAKLKEYNESNAMMNLVLFDMAMFHVVRIARILGAPRGNALLVGVGGSGKQSLSKLASFLNGYAVRQISVTSTYGVLDLKEELKNLYRFAGVKPNEPVTFILTDSHVVDERFLVYVNDLLASGVIPDLFQRDEYDAIFASLRGAAKAAGVAESQASMRDFFIERVLANLHVVLCFSPIGDTLRVRARKFPGLINCTAIDWFQPWPRRALVSVAQHFLQDANLGTPEMHDNVAHHVAQVHLSVGAMSLEYFEEERRFNYVTPASFLELITFYKSLFAERRSDLAASMTRLETGLQTLRATNADVIRLKADLKVKLVQVEERKVSCDEFLEKMGVQRGEAEAAQAEADRERSKADVAARGARDIEERAAGDLALAKPALDAALDAVNCLDKSSMTELKSFSNPPAGVDKVTAALLVLIKNEKRNFSWDNAKKMMAKVDAFKEQLEEFNGEDIPADVVARCEPYLSDPNFSYEKMKTKSAAAANLCNWVVNILGFHKVFKKVKPLMNELETAKDIKAVAEEDLAKVEEKLALIDAALTKLQASFMDATQRKAEVEKLARDCQDRLQLAERLTNGLASEYTRWGVEVDRLRQVDGTLVGDALLAAAFVSYSGAFGSKYRERLFKQRWLVDLNSREIPTADRVDPVKLLASESQMAEWMTEGLPADQFSVENGAIVDNCKRWPLLIDPQLQGIKWVKSREEKRVSSVSAEAKAVTVLQLSEKKWVGKVVVAIQSGGVVIIENLGETMDAVLDPILARSVVRKGKTLFIRLGGDDLEYDPGFRLYLQTRLANPHFKPEVSAQCTLINFIVTESGLEEQLLARVVDAEQPALEQEKDDLVRAFNTYKMQLQHLEDDLLFKLANAPADILSDIPLITGLEKTKATAAEITAAVERGKLAETGINEAREVYRPVANQASQLYFMLLKLGRLDHMYQYSLESFVKFFRNGTASAMQSSELHLRVDSLLASVRWTIFQWVSRGLFEKHRLVFVVQLALGLLQQGASQMADLGDPDDMGSASNLDKALKFPWAKIQQQVGYSNDGLHFLLRGPRKTSGEEPPAAWVSTAAWEMVQKLGDLPGFDKLPGDVASSAPRFLEWFNHPTPEDEKLPLDWRELDRKPFQKLLVVRCLRPDRLTPALKQFVSKLLPNGQKFCDLDSDLTSYGILEESFKQSSPSVPIYFILSPGANIVADVDRLAKKEGMDRGKTYFEISLGQGQDVVAAERLGDGARMGHWVMLNNVHLMPRWLASFEKLLDGYASSGCHAAFRVFLSSDPTSSIPVGILDRSIKLTSDPPSGLRANLKQAFSAFDREDFEELEPRTRGILFGLCYFHAVMLERRKFGAQGANMRYPFAVGDLLNSASVLRNCMENSPAKVPWDDLRYLFGEIMYGGHIVNDSDRLVCGEYLKFFLRDELLDEMDMFPFPDVKSDYFHAPETSLQYDKVMDHLESAGDTDSPLAFGLHPNAQVGFRTAASAQVCRSILDLAPGGGSGPTEASSAQNVAEGVLQDMLEQLREFPFDMDSISALLDDPGPFQNVFLQECELMNGLLFTILRSLEDLDLGFRGELTMSEQMETLQDALFLDCVPQVWADVAYPSRRGLSSWVVDLHLRIIQLGDWTRNPNDAPNVTWLPGLFQPASFLTAIMQATAQAQQLELDKLMVYTEVSKKNDASDVQAPSKDGAFISGLFLQGARWNGSNSALEAQLAGEMTMKMPVMNCRAGTATDQDSVYSCPCYKTMSRGPTFVFSAPLKTKHAASKWILAGTALIMDPAE